MNFQVLWYLSGSWLSFAWKMVVEYFYFFSDFKLFAPMKGNTHSSAVIWNIFMVNPFLNGSENGYKFCLGPRILFSTEARVGFIFFFFFFNIIALQCWVRLRCSVEWISNMYTYVPYLLDLSPIHPTHLGRRRAPSGAPALNSRFPLAVCIIHECVNVSGAFSVHPTFPSPTCPHVCSLPLSLPCKWVHLYHFLDSIYMH